MRISRAASAALIVVLATALTGCGGDDKNVASSSDPSSKATESDVKTLSKQEVKDAVISLDDLGDDFKLDKSDDDDDDSDTDLGCLNDIDKVLDDKADDSGADFDKAAAKAEAEYKADSDGEMPFVMSSVYSLKSTDEIEEGFKIFEDAFKECDSVDTTDKDGTRIKLSIDFDKAETDGATSQVNMTAAGNFAIKGPQGQSAELPFYLRMSLIQVDNNIAMIGYGSLVDDDEGDEDSESLNEVGIDRLQAVIDGKPAPEDPDLDLRLITEADILRALRNASGSA